MTKLAKYFKPFIFLTIIAMAFLFTQAMCDLKLPDYMSDIVNIGIQANGIEQVAPKAISENGMNLMKSFMTDEEISKVDNTYTKISQKDSNYLGEYPEVENTNIYVQKEDLQEAEIEELNKIFAVSCKTMTNLMSNLGQNKGSNTEQTGDIDVTQIYQMIPMINMMPEENIIDAKNQAEQTPENMLESIGLVFTQSFYKELGVDISKLQNEFIVKTGFKMLGVCVLGIVAAILVGFLGSRIGGGIARNLRNDVFQKVQSFSTAEFNNFSAASLITRTTNDITQIQNFVIMMIRMLAYAPIMGIGSLIMMSQKTTELIWTIALACGFIILMIVFLFKMVFPKIKIVQKLTDKINLVSKESLSGLMVIRAFGTQKYEENRFDEVNSEVMKNNKFINRSMGMMMPTMTLIMNGLNLLILWAGADAIAKSSIQVGDLMAVMQYGIEVVMSFLFVSMIFIMFPRASVSANRIAEALETESSINDPENPMKFDENKKGYVEFENVTFSYPDADEKVLENINFVAKPGETTAIIGATGSGKTTIAKLALRLFDCTEGQVKVNGTNVKEMTQFDLHNQIGYIPQKGSLLSGTIESNLKYGNEMAEDEFVKKCAEVAQATEFIESKEEKYNSPISQGAKNVSGGQKQRLAITRALVKNSPIYIFDDSFSALDFKTDTKLRAALKKHTGNATLLIVAQRVSTIMNAEQIIVLEDGKIVGKGTHSELLAKCPTYYEIASSQLSKEELENGGKQ